MARVKLTIKWKFILQCRTGGAGNGSRGRHPMIETASGKRRANLRRLFEQSSVAVLGASQNRAKPGGRTLAYLAAAGLPGRVFTIKPRRSHLFGWTALTTIASLPEGRYHAVEGKEGVMKVNKRGKWYQ